MVIQTLPQTELSQSPDLLRHIPPSIVPASRLVSSDQLPRRARNPVSGGSAPAPTISCPYYKSELYIVSEEQAFRSQQGRPFRNDVADCVAIASSTPSSLSMPHRSFLRSPDVQGPGSVAPAPNVDVQNPEFLMRHSYSGGLSQSSTSSVETLSSPVSASSGLSSVQYNRPVSASRQSLTESKWKWLHSNAMAPEQPSPISLRRTTWMDVPSASQSSASPVCRDTRQDSLSAPFRQGPSDGLMSDEVRASRMYYSKPVADRGVTEGDPPQRRKTAVDLIQSVPDVHRSVDDQSVRHWRHSSDNTARNSAADDPRTRKWDTYGLTVGFSGAAVSRSGPTAGNGDRKSEAVSANGHSASSAGDAPQKLALERIMRFDCPSAGALVPQTAAVPSNTRRVSEGAASRAARSEPTAVADSTTHSNFKAKVSTPSGGRSGRLSVPDSIPIYFRAEPSATLSQSGTSCVEVKPESKTVTYSTGGRLQPSYVASSQSSTSAGT